MATKNKAESEAAGKLTLAAKLAKIGQAVGAIEKSGRNQDQKYNFIPYAEVAARIREQLAQNSVAIIPSVRNVECQEVRSTRGGVGYHYTLAMHFTIADGESDDKIEADWTGEATDYGDKGVNKAITAGTKYFLMRLFNVSESEAEDADAPEEDDTNEIHRVQMSARRAPASGKAIITYDFAHLEEKLADETSVSHLRHVYKIEKAMFYEAMQQWQRDKFDRMFAERAAELEGGSES